MRVLIVGHRFPPDGVAGVERIMQSLATELTKVGDEVSILCHRPGPSEDEPVILRERLVNDARVYRIAGGPLELDRFEPQPDAIERLMTETLLETNADLVHIHHLIGLSPRFPEIVRRHRIPLIISLQDFYFACPLAHLQTPSGKLCDGPRGGAACATTCFAYQGQTARLRWGIRASYFRRILSLASRIICPSQYVADYFGRFGADPSKICVVPNGVDVHREPRGQVPRSAEIKPGLRLAFLGAVVRHKGVHVILEALRHAKLHRADLLVLGVLPDTTYVDELRALAHDIPGLTLRLHGSYAPSEVSELLEGVDCVVAPSQVPESFSITVREAFACGIPVLASRLGALEEAIADGVNGFTFTHDSSEDLANRLLLIAGDEALRAELVQGATATSVMTASDHASCIRAHYADARAEELHSPVPSDGDIAELEMFSNVLLAGPAHVHPTNVDMTPLQPGTGAGPPSVTIEAIALIPVPEALSGRDVDTLPGAQAGYSLMLSGWVLGRDVATIAVELTSLGRTLVHAPVMIERPDVASVYTTIPRAHDCGFQLVVNMLGLPASFELGIQAVLQDLRRVPLGVIRGRRQMIRTRFSPKIQPIMLTSIGRSGTHWLTAVLSQDERIIAYRVLELEPRFLNYWVSVLRSLSDPMSFLQSLTAADMSSEHWWLGRGEFELPSFDAEEDLKAWLARTGLSDVVAFWSNESDLVAHQWLSSTHIEEMARFCQTRIEGFYTNALRSAAGAEATYFIEKSLPHALGPDVTWELYPDGRELLLVRDFRDVACSMLAFGKKLGFVERSRKPSEEQLRALSNSASSLLEAWQMRRGRAHLVRYEDLIREPTATVSAILDYLDLGGETGAAQRMLEGAARAFPDRQSMHRTIEDPLATIGRWRHEMDRETKKIVGSALAEVLEEFGYDASKPSGRKRGG